MEAAAAETLAVDLMADFGLEGWRFVWDNARRRFGQCRHNGQEISLSLPLVKLNDQPEVEDVIRHEIAHAIAGPAAGHGHRWRVQAVRCGARPERCFSSAVATPPRRYTVACLGCGAGGQRDRKPTRAHVCGRCGGPLTWTRNDITTTEER